MPTSIAAYRALSCGSYSASTRRPASKPFSRPTRRKTECRRGRQGTLLLRVRRPFPAVRESKAEAGELLLR
eukprot:13400400-Heterocapsa_arctica.AAC.1